MPPKHACDTCYRRKIQCSIPNPGSPCDWCKHHARVCTFDKERPRKSRKIRVTQEHVQELLQRIQDLENRQALQSLPAAELTPASSETSPRGGETPHVPTISDPVISIDTPNSTSQSLPTPATTTVSSLAQFQPTHIGAVDIFPVKQYAGPYWFFSGFPIFSDRGEQWLRSKTDQSVKLANYSVLRSKPVVESPFPEDELSKLPDKETAQNIFAVYFQSSLRLCVPILDRQLLDKTVETAYEHTDKPLSLASHVLARACILSTLSMICRYQGETTRDNGINAELCSSKARTLFLRVCGDSSIVSAQTALTLHIQYAWTGQWHDADAFLSMACRIVSSLGGHTFPSNNSEHGDLVRNLFWLCYIYDKDFCLLVGRTPFLSEAYSDLSVPATYENYYSYLPNLDNNSCEGEQLAPYFCGDLHLSQIKEKVYRTLYSASALKTTDGVLDHIRQLDDEIERWRLSIPANFRPVLSLSSVAPRLHANLKLPCRMRYIRLQLEYHHIITVVHSTVRRYCAVPESFHMVIHSSIDLTLEASRSTLLCMKEVIQYVPEHIFPLLTFHPISAALAIFLNIVVHPHSDEVDMDVERLVSAANAVRSLQGRTFSTKEMQRIKDTSDFMMNLVWLGTCAVMKAKRENPDGPGG